MPDEQSLQQLILRLRHPGHTLTLDSAMVRLLEDAATAVEGLVALTARLKCIEAMLDALELQQLAMWVGDDTRH